MAQQFVSIRRKKPQEPPKADPSRLNSTPNGTPEPDVTWGKGGIDDWGWQAQAAVPAPAPPVPSLSPSIPPKEPIPHV